MKTKYSEPRLYIDKSAIKHNFNEIQKKIGDKCLIMPIVKANSYGVGLKEALSIFEDSKFFGVADINEALEVKRLRPDSDLLIIYQPNILDIEKIIENDIRASVAEIRFAKELNEVAKKYNKKALIHLEIDTGVGRLGILPNELEEFLKELKNFQNLLVEGMYMHYSSADSLAIADLEFTGKQTEIFEESLKIVKSVIEEVKYIHSSAGAAIFNPNTKSYNMVRPGYILYGYYNNQDFRQFVTLKPALKLGASIIRIKEYDKGTSISYSRKYQTTRKTKIATVAIGYADGVSRNLFNKDKKEKCYVVVNKQKSPIVGTICMDLITIDITDIKGNIDIGDEVLIWDNELVTLEDLAEYGNTIGCEFITRLNSNIVKVID